LDLARFNVPPNTL